MRVAIGFIGSSGIARVSCRNGFTHQFCAMPMSMAKTGLRSSSDSASAGVEEAHMVERDDDVGAGLVEIVEALHLDRGRARDR